jgi:undecaprenyl-diphosphatase
LTRWDRRTFQSVWQPLSRLARPSLLFTLFALGLGGVFVRIAAEMREGETKAFDTYILDLFRDSADPSRPIGPLWLYEATRDVTALGSYAILTTIVVLVLLYLLLSGRRRDAVHLGVGVVAGTILSNLLKIGFNRPRPSIASVPEVFSASFPSGHATMSAVVYLTLAVMLALHEDNKALRGLYLIAAVVLTFVVGLSRIYLGVHYPTDVLAGWCLGTAWAIACAVVSEWWRNRSANGT